MQSLSCLIKRNIKMFFKDKGLFFTSLITPLILLVLYSTFLSNVYYNAFDTVISNAGIEVDSQLLKSLVAAQLVSSLLAVCCITVAFCSNMLMVQDKATGVIQDICITPVKRSTLAYGYYIASFIATLIICIIACIAGFVYMASVGWYMSVSDTFCILIDVFLLVMMGTALSSIINHFLSSQGQISAVGSIVSSCYGFICGAYMPISNFSESLQKVLSFLPFTYATSLLRNHSMNGVFSALEAEKIPEELIKEFRQTVDCDISFMGNSVSIASMYAFVSIFIIALIIVYILINILTKNNEKR